MLTVGDRWDCELCLMLLLSMQFCTLLRWQMALQGNHAGQTKHSACCVCHFYAWRVSKEGWSLSLVHVINSNMHCTYIFIKVFKGATLMPFHLALLMRDDRGTCYGLPDDLTIDLSPWGECHKTSFSYALEGIQKQVGLSHTPLDWTVITVASWLIWSPG